MNLSTFFNSCHICKVNKFVRIILYGHYTGTTTEDIIRYYSRLNENICRFYATKVVLVASCICIRSGTETAAENLTARKLVVGHNFCVLANISGETASMNILECKSGYTE